MPPHYLKHLGEQETAGLGPMGRTTPHVMIQRGIGVLHPRLDPLPPSPAARAPLHLRLE